mmetsp:Transcript_28337/g.47546  ORF Transcript_28337/g.47546 Transcript_28337/m.47546 type:complete len:268 (+) Transcript_28337:75-878(+)|eukprot:CAMPEP_0198210230 /NCGR_PEP_ID=MMETSP1445-20131203/19974_1 /TAXON_ID=36898 /ORGANISM="Pyramimonas sp., Strain CCMP2087" /LENGTH=267 /DNA_ID=CAMNT_0043884241 /DNA_START=69 /DNA_END=872 /DNA_ORIENTATION=-
MLRGIQALANRASAQNGLAQCMRAMSTTPRSKPGIYEVRTYTLKPEGFAPYVQMAIEYGDLRKQVNPHLLGFFTTEVGGCLHQVKHIYHYEDLNHREQVRKSMSKVKEWAHEYLPKSRVHVSHQESMIFVEAADCHTAAGIPSAVDFVSPAKPSDPDAPTPVYELRTYQCRLGYDTVPKLRAHMASGLPSKVEADKKGQLVMYASSDVGVLNNVIEIWRYPSFQGSLEARQAARTAQPWKDAVANVASLANSFTTQFLAPVSISKWQ